MRNLVHIFFIHSLFFKLCILTSVQAVHNSRRNKRQKEVQSQIWSDSLKLNSYMNTQTKLINNNNNKLCRYYDHYVIVFKSTYISALQEFFSKYNILTTCIIIIKRYMITSLRLQTQNRNLKKHEKGIPTWKMDPMMSILPITTSTGSMPSICPMGVSVSSASKAP